MADIDSAFAKTKQSLDAGEQALKTRLESRQADDRSLIARVVIGAFVGMVIWVVIMATLGAYLYDWETLVEPGKFLMGILGSIMLPVVTLVIGYYFSNK